MVNNTSRIEVKNFCMAGLPLTNYQWLIQRKSKQETCRRQKIITLLYSAINKRSFSGIHNLEEIINDFFVTNKMMWLYVVRDGAHLPAPFFFSFRSRKNNNRNTG